MEKWPPSFEQRAHALSPEQMAAFSLDVTRTAKREQLYPSKPPELDLEHIKTSATRYGLFVMSQDKHTIKLSDRSPSDYASEVDSVWRRVGTPKSFPYYVTINKYSNWRVHSTSDAGFSFEWRLANLTNQHGQHQKIPDHLHYNKRIALENELSQYIRREIVGFPTDVIKVPRRMPWCERQLLLEMIATDNPLRGFLDGTFDDCVYRLELEDYSPGDDGLAPPISPRKTEKTVKDAFVSTNPEDMFWYAHNADYGMGECSPYANCTYSLKVIRPRRFKMAELHQKRSHSHCLDRFEIWLEEGETLASFLVNSTDTTKSGPDQLLMFCIRGPRQLQNYGPEYNNWNITDTEWRQYTNEGAELRGQRFSKSTKK